ncbi:MAG: Plug domain-containing protein, partial [Desulfobacterales bacterium]|nr:Plug domain-containing protein [Desulfobacterales bacterium]
MIQTRYPVDEPPPRLKRDGWNGTAVLVILVLVSALCHAEAPGDPDETVEYLKSLSLEDLADLQVTSVSKKAEKLVDAPAAVFVITNEDIRRSGATSIPEALRMAPGVQVARINAYSWAITARGFNSNFSNKLLVLIDGRAVYSPLYSGVYWRARDTLLEDIDRIEVIRGPGA